MKIKFLLIALVVLVLSACTQKTCPTYAGTEQVQDATEQPA
jgi:PBP1b-binding outer membrane lipoprotein LpoB